MPWKFTVIVLLVVVLLIVKLYTSSGLEEVSVIFCYLGVTVKPLQLSYWDNKFPNSSEEIMKCRREVVQLNKTDCVTRLFYQRVRSECSTPITKRTQRRTGLAVLGAEPIWSLTHFCKISQHGIQGVPSVVNIADKRDLHVVSFRHN